MTQKTISQLFPFCHQLWKKCFSKVRQVMPKQNFWFDMAHGKKGAILEICSLFLD